jgi:hypothetical protein
MLEFVMVIRKKVEPMEYIITLLCSLIDKVSLFIFLLKFPFAYFVLFFVLIHQTTGNELINYRKAHLWSDYERKYYTPGQKLGPVVTFDVCQNTQKKNRIRKEIKKQKKRLNTK